MGSGAIFVSGAIVLGMLLLVVIPRCYTARTRASLFSARRLREVQEALARWNATLARDCQQFLGSIKGASEGASHVFVLGGLALLFWPVVALLNSVILAQILEIYLPPTAETLAIPYIGEYNPLAVVFALIITGIEGIAAIALWHYQRIAVRIIAGLIAVTTVGFEAFGGYMRARLIEGTDEALASSVNILGSQSAIVSGMISFAAPLAEMIASVFVFEGLLVPIGYQGLRLFRIMALWLAKGFATLIYGPFLREPFLEDAVIAPEEPVEEEPEPDQRILAANIASQSILDDALTIKTGSMTLLASSTSVVGGIGAFLTTRLRQWPQRKVDVDPQMIVAAFMRTLEKVRNEPVYQECARYAQQELPQNPEIAYRQFTREMLIAEMNALESKRARLHELVQTIAREAYALAESQLERIKQTDALLWSQNPDAKVEWETLRTTEKTLEQQHAALESKLVQCATQRREILQSLNEVVDNPLLAQDTPQAQNENLRTIKVICTRVGFDETQEEEFPALCKLFLLPDEAGDEAQGKAHVRDTAMTIVTTSRQRLQDAAQRLEEARTRMHQVADQLIEVQCQENPDGLCLMCPRCEQYRMTMRTQHAQLDQDCAEFERALTVRFGQVQRLLRRKSLWGRIRTKIDAWFDRQQ